VPVSVITTIVGSLCTSCNRCECVIPNIIAVFFCKVLQAYVCMCLCALELFFACHGPDCKFLEKSVRAGVNNLLTVLSFTVEKNTANIIRKYVNSRDVSLMQLRILQKVLKYRYVALLFLVLQ